MTIRKPTPPKGCYENMGPHEPLMPTQTLSSNTIVKNIGYSEYSSVKIQEMIDILSEYPDGTITFDVDVDHYDRTVERINVNISSPDIPNPEYDKQMERYKIEKAKYDKLKVAYDKYRKELKAWQDKDTARKEKQLLKKLKEKYES